MENIEKIGRKIIDIIGWCLLAFVIVFFIAFMIHIFSPQTLYGDIYVKEQYRYDISAIEDNRDVKGRMYYRSGRIEQKLYYYLVKENSGYKEVVKIPADKTRIIETNKEQPKVIYYAEYFSNTNELVDSWNYGNDYYLLYIPENTVTTDWNIDLE